MSVAFAKGCAGFKHAGSAGFQQAGYNGATVKPFVFGGATDRAPRASPERRRVAEARGRDAEDRVAAAWEARGFSVLARRLRTKAGELDLVLADQNTLIFMEVKARASLDEAAHSISARQQGRLLDAAGLALAEHQEWERPATRFDVSLVTPGGTSHIEDALRAS